MLSFIHLYKRWDFLQIDPQMHTRGQLRSGPRFLKTSQRAAAGEGAC